MGNCTRTSNLDKVIQFGKTIRVNIIDKERLIPDRSFTSATTYEAKVQIRLAEIKHLIPSIREIAKISAGNARHGKGDSDKYEVDVKLRDLKRRCHS